MSPHVTYNPKAGDRAYLPYAGLYGPGQQHDAEVVLFSVELARPDSLDAPFGDKQCALDSYTVWKFRITYEGMLCFAQSRAQANTLPNAGSKNLAWMTNLGITPNDTDPETGHPSFDLDKLSNIPCIVKVSAPRQDKHDEAVFYTGTVTDVFGLPSAR